MWWPKQRAAAEVALLIALLEGAVLKAHRDLDGIKIHKLHQPNQPPIVMNEPTVRRLAQQQLIQSNLKFPAATYLLTEQGAALARELAGRQGTPLTVRRGLEINR